jgi:hypothetical protein
MRRRRVEVVIKLLDIFTVVTFRSGKTKEPFFQDRIATIPESKGKAEALVVVTNAKQPVFTPAVGAGTGVIVRQVIPGIAVFGIVLPNGAPGTFGQIGTPATPMLFAA